MGNVAKGFKHYLPIFISFRTVPMRNKIPTEPIPKLPTLVGAKNGNLASAAELHNETIGRIFLRKHRGVILTDDIRT